MTHDASQEPPASTLYSTLRVTTRAYDLARKRHERAAAAFTKAIEQLDNAEAAMKAAARALQPDLPTLPPDDGLALGLPWECETGGLAGANRGA